MKRALIATLFNEADNVSRWWDCLMQQTVLPDEIVVVDGGSTDGTWEKLRALADVSRVPVKLAQHRCNIAEGRNHAIGLTDAGIIAATDAGSFPEHNWFAEITQPLIKNPNLDFVGGLNIAETGNPFQIFLSQFEPLQERCIIDEELNPSSRNTAFRRAAWQAVGGYPEWLTLAGEDALFTQQLNKIGQKGFYNAAAIVHWSVRDTMAAYFKLLHRNAYGAAEAQLYWPYFRQRLIITFFPPLLLLSRHRFHYLKFRYLKNYSSASGWLAGWLKGRKPPTGWIRVEGILLSPQAWLAWQTKRIAK